MVPQRGRAATKEGPPQRSQRPRRQRRASGLPEVRAGEWVGKSCTVYKILEVSSKEDRTGTRSCGGRLKRPSSVRLLRRCRVACSRRRGHGSRPRDVLTKTWACDPTIDPFGD